MNSLSNSKVAVLPYSIGPIKGNRNSVHRSEDPTQEPSPIGLSQITSDGQTKIWDCASKQPNKLPLDDPFGHV